VQIADCECGSGCFYQACKLGHAKSWPNDVFAFLSTRALIFWLVPANDTDIEINLFAVEIKLQLVFATFFLQATDSIFSCCMGQSDFCLLKSYALRTKKLASESGWPLAKSKYFG
jgi:hypothetical protein